MNWERGQSALGDLNSRLARLRKELPFWHRFGAGVYHAMISAVAALVAYLPVDLLGFQEAFWGAITAIAVVQTEFQATQSTARDQFIGAAVGGCVALCMRLVFGEHLIVYTAAVVLGMLVCSILNVASASRLAGSTVTIILLVPHRGPPEQIIFARTSEVAWGVLVAIRTAWLTSRLSVPFRDGAAPGDRAQPQIAARLSGARENDQNSVRL